MGVGMNARLRFMNETGFSKKNAPSWKRLIETIEGAGASTVDRSLELGLVSPLAPPDSLLGTPMRPSEPSFLMGDDLVSCGQWLAEHRVWGQLPEADLRAIAQTLQRLSLPAETPIYQAGQIPLGLYLLEQGTVEIYRQTPIGKSLVCFRHRGDLFGYVPLLAGDLGGQYQANTITRSPCEIYFLARSDLQQLLQSHPVLQPIMNAFLAQDLMAYSQRIGWERERIQGLQPYIQALPEDAPVWGTSKAAQKLIPQIAMAANTLQPVVLQAPAGSGKTFMAGLIHRRSALAEHPFTEIDCAQLPRLPNGQFDTTIIFGDPNGSPGILALLEQGTLLLDNAHVLSEADRDRLLSYLSPTDPQPTARVSHPPVDTTAVIPTYHPIVRLIFASPRQLERPGTDWLSIKLFALPQRKEDIPSFAQHFVAKFCHAQNRPPLRLDPTDLRRLVSYDYPGNLTELAEILHRAVIMTPPAHDVIAEQVLWSVQSAKNAFRLDLLTHVPWLRRALLSRWYPQALWVAMMVVFVPVTVLGFIGPQDRGDSVTLNLFWAWWWPGYLFYFAFIGRLWCAVCPFMITGEVARRVSLWLWPRQQLTWPTQWLNRWGAWWLFGGFVVIYLWEKLWDLPHHADLSAWLLLAIAAGAVIFSLIYERRLWCRYLCPIGGMNGMFAKLSMIELRSVQQVCGSQCQTFGCYKGSESTPLTFADALPTEGQAVAGCPLYSHPAQLRDNRDCVLCMTCLKACPNRSVQLNLRFPASDLLDHHQGFWAEIALLLLLFGGVFMHHGQTLLRWLGHPDIPLDAAHLQTSLPIALALLSMPAVFTYGTHAIARLLDPQQPPYRAVIYAYLPFVLAANLAHYIPAAITEAGNLLPVLARTLGFSGAGLPTLTWEPNVAAFLQGVTLLSALVFSPYPLQRITQRPWVRNLPHLILMGLLTGLFFQLMV
jgi:polyferredoxin/CRP-like cAMP-binding protein